MHYNIARRNSRVRDCAAILKWSPQQLRRNVPTWKMICWRFVFVSKIASISFQQSIFARGCKFVLSYPCQDIKKFTPFKKVVRQIVGTLTPNDSLASRSPLCLLPFPFPRVGEHSRIFYFHFELENRESKSRQTMKASPDCLIGPFDKQHKWKCCLERRREKTVWKFAIARRMKRILEAYPVTQTNFCVHISRGGKNIFPMILIAKRREKGKRQRKWKCKKLSRWINWSQMLRSKD